MEALYIHSTKEDRLMMEEEDHEKSREQGEGGVEACSPLCSTDEETDEDSEPEPPPVIRRKVSFADAFGLDLVSVKEFDNVEVTDSDTIKSSKMEETLPLEEFYMSCLFTVPSSPEELDQQLQMHMVELESIELLPRSTTLRGIIRVVNLCYNKFVFVRMTMDCWDSYFDLLAEYVPGSSDRKTDRFTFRCTLIPPFEREGTRVEFCLRYETHIGTFWANNRGMNYVLFFHQKEHLKEHVPQVQEESTSYRSKRSCLKANRRGHAEENTREAINSTVTTEAEVADRDTGIQSLLCREEGKTLVDSIKSQHKATRLARMQDHHFQRRQHVPEAYSHDFAIGQKVSDSTLWGDSACTLQNCPKTQSNKGPQVLTYHQIPLLTLDWNNDKPQPMAADVNGIWTDGAKMALSKASEDTASVSNVWEAFLHGTDETHDKESSVCDVWQAFLNGPNLKDHSGVPESEWLQTAASVSPSNDKETHTQCAVRSQVQYQVGKDTPNNFHAHTSSACQPLSDTCETPLVNAALNTEDHQPAEACASSPRDDNTAAQDASQRSQTNSVTETIQKFSLMGPMPVAKGSVDSSREWHKHEIWERKREGIIGGAEGIGGDEPLTLHTADLVTSSGESETTDMTAMPESQNANAVDTISQGAKLDEGLSCSREGEVTGTTHNVVDDTLAFTETIRQGTEEGERFVFSISRQGVEEGITINCTGNKESQEEEIFRPQKTEECQISQRYTDQEQCQEIRQNHNLLKPNEQDENKSPQSHANELILNQACEEHFRQTLAELKREGVTSHKDLEVFKEAEVEPLCCKTSEDTKRLIGAESETIQLLNEDAWPRNDTASKPNLPAFSEIHNMRLKPIAAGEKQCNQKEIKKEEEAGDNALVSKPEKRIHLNGGEIIESKKIPPSSERRVELFLHSAGSLGTKKALKSDCNIFKFFPIDKYSQPEVVEKSFTHSHDDVKGHSEDIGSGISSDKIVLKENIIKEDTSTELQHQREILERTEEDMSQRDKDERVGTEKLKIEELEELIGNVENPPGESKNAPAELKEQELSAEVESSPHVEYNKMAEGTKYPIEAENIVRLEAKSGLNKIFLERFGKELVRKIWKQVFDGKYNTPVSNITTEGSVTDICDTMDACHFVRATLTSDKAPDEKLDSGVFSMNCDEYSLAERGQPLNKTEETHFAFHLNTSIHFSEGLESTLGTQSCPLLTESARSSPEDQEQSEIKEGSATLQKADSQIEDCVVAHRETCDRSAQSSHKHQRSSLKDVKQADSSGWWSILYILGHITRLLICAFLVSGFFFIFFLYDFPAFFAFYIVSVCWWFHTWKRYRVIKNTVPPPDRRVACSGH